MQPAHVAPTVELQWPDFYMVLGISSQEDMATVKKAIHSLSERANAACDHSDPSVRFYSQVLREKVLPQCLRILLDPPLRMAYDEQLRLHRQGSLSARSYTQFIAQISRTQPVSTAFVYTVREIAVLSGFQSASHLASVLPPVPAPAPALGAWRQAQVHPSPTERATMCFTPSASSPPVAVLDISGKALCAWESEVIPMRNTAHVLAPEMAFFSDSERQAKRRPNIGAILGASVAGLGLLAGVALSQSQSAPAGLAQLSGALPHRERKSSGDWSAKRSKARAVSNRLTVKAKAGLNKR